MKKLLALGLLAGLGVWAWGKLRGAPIIPTGASFQVALQPVQYSTIWSAWWWDGNSLVPNARGMRRPVTEAALFKNVDSAPGSYVLIEVVIQGLPYQNAAMLPNPVDGGAYIFDWYAKTLTLKLPGT